MPKDEWASTRRRDAMRRATARYEPDALERQVREINGHLRRQSHCPAKPSLAERRRAERIRRELLPTYLIPGGVKCRIRRIGQSEWKLYTTRRRQMLQGDEWAPGVLWFRHCGFEMIIAACEVKPID